MAARSACRRKNNVSGIFALVYAPVVGHPKIPVNGIEAVCHLIQPMVESLHLQSVDDLLGPLPIGDVHERIVDQLVVNLALAEDAGQPTVPVKVDGSLEEIVG